ncbi:glycosyl transferase group 1 [Gemmatirosa kalamazoonensis]|uniref:Glycosyl transferase group 1 n=1 Tax=Gemmatirosa kalamazoonensis TaxID=861299 RepID=W0RD54_9BACT|nr:glycosyltransferase family 4 protein [Gemmatirosa kalamazoonensis]AHG88377.1 glycosyl transferase group 1 [Gemmatirosa kalamazoonensis]
MRLALVLPGGVDRSGTDRVIPARLWLLERLARRHDVHVFALGQDDAPGEWDLLGARVHDVGSAPRKLRRLLACFGAQHAVARFDVVHAFFGWAGAYAALLGWRHRLPVVYSPSGGEHVAMRDIGYGMRCTLVGRAGAAVAAAGASRVTVATPHMQRLAAARGVRAERVPLGVAVDRWPAAPLRPRDRARPARLLHVGDLRPVKDQAMLLAAARRLREAGARFTLDIVGRDTTGGALRRSADAAWLGDIVRWHGPLGRDALRTLVDEADLLLVSSRHEAGPLVVLEAAVAGVPTVGTAVGHVAEWAPDAAVAVPVGDADALARETAALLDDEPRRLALAVAAQRLALGMDADATAAAFERIYAAL